jgi:undecaprenyl-diphosphatase
VSPSLQAAVLGVVQGLTEFLPVSSSGHLAIVPRLLGWEPMGKAFDVSLHFGTLVALTAYYRDEVFPTRLVVWLGLASLPAGAVGYFLGPLVERHAGGLGLTVALLGLFGALLGLADRCPRSGELQDLRWRQVLGIGLAQALALLPGVSRSGVTITAGLAAGLGRREAAHFAFLLGLPITLAACLHKFATAPVLNAPFLVGAVTSGVTGWLCIRVLMRYLQRGSYLLFATYRVAVSLILMMWTVTR